MIILRLDKNGGINKGDIKAFEHDNKSETYIIQLYKNNEVYDLTNKTVELTIVEKKRKYGDMVTLPVESATEGKVKLEIVSSITKQDGTYDFKLTVKDTAGLIETFPNFQVKIDTDITKNIAGEIVEDKNFTILTEGLKALSEYEVYKTNAKKVPDIEKNVANLGSQLDNNVNLGYANSKIQTSKKRFESNFINLLDFNVDSTGVVDCCAQLQNAIDYAYTEKTPLYIPPGIYKLSSKSIILPPKITIIGANNYNDFGLADIKKYETLFQCSFNPAFTGDNATNKNPTTCVAVIKNIAFNSYGTSNKNCFEFINFKNTTIENCWFRDFYITINCPFSQISYIKNNTFLNCKKSAISNSIFSGDYKNFTDSYICNNYINGSIDFNEPSILIDLNYANMGEISCNFIDFGLIGIKLIGGQLFKVRDNIIDYCMTGINISSMANMSFNGNTFNHCSLAYKDKWTNSSLTFPTISKAFDCVIGLQKIDIFENKMRDCDNPICFHGTGFKDINTNNNTYVNTSSVLSNPISLKLNKDTNYIGDGTNLIFKDLNFIKLNSLPNPSTINPAGSFCETFDGHIFYYNDKLIKNDNGVYKDMLGNIVT